MAHVKDDPVLMQQLNDAIAQLQTDVSEMNVKRGRSYLRWLKTHKNYLKWETYFNPRKLKTYARKEVVLVEFGFNTESELGGPHWAVVIDDNYWSSPTAIVVPLGSLDPEEDENELHRDDVLLGVIPSINDKRVYAKPNQIRTVSKLRIISPKQKGDPVHKLTDKQMDDIDEKLFELMFKNSKKIYEIIASSLKEVASGIDNTK